MQEDLHATLTAYCYQTRREKQVVVESAIRMFLMSDKEDQDYYISHRAYTPDDLDLSELEDLYRKVKKDRRDNLARRAGRKSKKSRASSP